MRNLNVIAKETNNSVSAACDSVLKVAKHNFVGKDCLITRGKFRGRKAQIQSVCISSDATGTYYIGALAHPYKLERDGSIAQPVEFLWDDRQARTYWPLTELSFD